jgi:uncharacterized membrane protein YccC
MTAPAPPPPRVHPRPLEAFWRALTQFDRNRIHPWMGVRNAIGITLPLAIGVAAGFPGSGVVAATGALNVAAADGVDSYRSRAARMLTSSVIGALAVFIGALAARNAIAVVVVRMLWAFAAGLVVCLGTVAADIGVISLVVIIIYTAQTMTPAHAALAGAAALGAGIFQTALSIALWPIRGRQPERRAIGDFYLALAGSATVPANPYDAPLNSQQSTQAQDALSSLAGDHHVETERLFLLVSQAERIRLSLFALARNQMRIRRDDADQSSVVVIDGFLELASRVLAAIGNALRGEPLSELVPAWLEQAATAATSADLPAASKAQLADATFQMDALAGQLRAAFELAGSTTPAGEDAFRERQERTPWYLRLTGWLATLGANLSLDSSACRHAIRLTLCILIGEVIARSFVLPRSYWLAMTIAIVLKPDFGNTFSRGVLRLAGTYAGLMLATVLVHFVAPTASVDVALIAILALILRSMGRANYGIFVTVLSALIVFLFSVNGVAPQIVIAARALNTTIGGTLALVVYLVWPTRERTHVPQALASMLDAYRVYFHAIARACIDGRRIAPRDLDRIRIGGRRARSNVETSVDRWSIEPNVEAAQLRLVNAMLASSHRFIHSVMALEAGLTPEPSAVARESFEIFARDLEKILDALAAWLRGSATPRNLPDLREDYNRLIRSGESSLVSIEADRMTNSLNTLAEQLARWVG